MTNDRSRPGCIQQERARIASDRQGRSKRRSGQSLSVCLTCGRETRIAGRTRDAGIPGAHERRRRDKSRPLARRRARHTAASGRSTRTPVSSIRRPAPAQSRHREPRKRPARRRRPTHRRQTPESAHRAAVASPCHSACLASATSGTLRNLARPLKVSFAAQCRPLRRAAITRALAKADAPSSKESSNGQCAAFDYREANGEIPGSIGSGVTVH